MIKHYINTAWRTLWHNRGTSSLNIGGLVIGITASILILLWAQNELRYDNYHKDAEQIHMLVDHKTSQGTFYEWSPYPAYAAIREAVPEIEMIAMAQSTLSTDNIFEVNGNRFREKNALVVDSNWIKMFSYEVVQGSLDFFDSNSNAIVITQSKAKKYFGDLPPLDQTLLIDSVPYTIAAVVADVPSNSSFQQDILLPNSLRFKEKLGSSALTTWGFNSQWLFVKLYSGASPSVTTQKIDKIFSDNRLGNKQITDRRTLLPLMDLHFEQRLNSTLIHRGNIQAVKVFSLLALLLLITACINFVNISIARIGVRLKEIGVRKIVGAAKRQLFTQIMVENSLSVTIAMLLALFSTAIVLPYFNTFTEKHLSLQVWDGAILLTFSGIFIFVLLLTGIYPALLLATLKPMGLLRNRGLAGLSKQGLRKTLVIGQLALTVVILIGIITIHRQYAFIQQQLSGYQKEQVFKLYARFEVPVHENYEDAINKYINTVNSIKTDLLTSSTVQAVSRVNGVSMINDNRPGPSGIVWTGYPEVQSQPNAVKLEVDEDYATFANLTLKSGRWFNAGNVSDKSNMVLNETAVKAFGLQEPVVGTVFSGGFTEADGVIIGVVKDFHHKSLREKTDPLLIVMNPSSMGGLFLIKAREGNITQALKHTETVWKTRLPNQPFEYTFLDEEFDLLYKRDLKSLSISITLGSLSILILCFGLLGMVMISAQQRTKEIGIRKVLGAPVLGILKLLCKDFVKLVLIAFTLASPIAWWSVSRWLDDFAYRIAIQWWMFAAAGLAVVAITLLTVGFHAIKAAAANPVRSLRDE